ncbi:MAG: hypothetical protein HBSIN02_14170 [Bacteroidia bacterium]|nr:MAG: hypothetical protein HBSIN02_14170 [Bacteroidia bacterium]
MRIVTGRALDKSLLSGDGKTTMNTLTEEKFLIGSPVGSIGLHPLLVRMAFHTPACDLIAFWHT